MNQRPDQRRFARTEVAFQVDDAPGTKQWRETGPQTLRCSLVGQFENSGKIGTMQDRNSEVDHRGLAESIRQAALALGFSAVGIARAEIGVEAANGLRNWLADGCHGSMDYMARHAELRLNPSSLQPGTLSVISVALDYLQAESAEQPAQVAAISRYARGRDYHKVVRQRLQKLAETIAARIGPFGYRVFSDSAPVMEVEFAQQAGLGWRGKHTLLLSRRGSWRFLGEIYTDLQLPPDPPSTAHCGQCTACIDACPTGAIVAPYRVDARRCISYLTIEHAGSIPEALRPLLGNRIYGCDDCQTCCPWNRFADIGDPDFRARHKLDAANLTDLFAWTPEQFSDRLAGNPIRRIGHERWLRNIAVALGNGKSSPETLAALQTHANHPSALVREHVAWAMERLAKN